MKVNQTSSIQWLKDTSLALPGLYEILSRSKSNILIIGAGVFGIYAAQGWIPPLNRRTGDLDLSVGLVNSANEYEYFKQKLVVHGYIQKAKEPEYRYFSPRILPNQPSYIDLLAHPASNKISKSIAIQAMGSGHAFSFEGMNFAKEEAYQLTKTAFYPNPIGFMCLKRISYLDDPVRRVKDLADIAELVYGIVQKGNHFELPELWSKVKSSPEALFVRQMLSALASGESTEWDLDNARQEFLSRGFDSEEIGNTIPSSIDELLNYFPI